jgi:pyruvate,water dikinase
MLLALGRVTAAAGIGSKAFNLGQLAQRGWPTPAGVVIPDPVFQQHVARAGTKAAIDDLCQRLDQLPEVEIKTASAAIRARITATAMDPALLRALTRRWQAEWQQRPLAVRSSAVGEDGARTSFAGQLDSYLDVTDGDALETAVKATWSSLFSLRVLLYARHHRLRLRQMGVIVQPQVDARLSGVLFTRDPSGRHPEAMLAEYCAGLGENVVGGRVTPARLHVQRDGLAVTVDHPGEDTPALDADARRAVQAIARMGLELEAATGVAQDMEWCIDGAGRPVIVQARPATRLATAANRQQVHWTNANIAENFPDPVSPFLFSLVKPGYSAYFRNLGRGFGVSRRRLAAMAGPLEDVVGLQGGRLYYNLSNIHALLQMMPAGRRLVEYFNLFVGAEPIPAPPRVPLGPLALVAETGRIAGSILWQYLFIEPRIRRFEGRVDAFADATRPPRLAGKSIAALAADLRGFLAIRLEQWNDAALADTAAMVCYGLLKAQLASALANDDQAALHNDLLKGLPQLASAEPVTRLWELSRGIEQDAALRSLFANASAEDILGQLEDPRFAAFRHAFAHYLDTWGFRSSGELMLTTPTPQENPLPVLRLLRTYVRTRARNPEDLTRRQGREREAATAAVAARLSPAWWRWVPLLSRASRFRLLLAATQGAIKLRERARMKQALLYTRLRHIALQLGERWVAGGLLDRRDDVFLLTVDEVQALADGEIADVAALVEPRRKAQAAFHAQQPPDRLVLAAGAQWQPESSTPADATGAAGRAQRLAGHAACGGSATGAAAVVLDVAHADRVQAGQILVTRQTDPGWATVFFLVRGLVIERGGMLSHGAIIAREYGIPAVVGVPQATQLIRDGEHVRVDGDHGVVELNGR